MGLRETGYKFAERIEPAQDKVKWRDVINATMNLTFQ